jgi:hypothetical protein
VTRSITDTKLFGLIGEADPLIMDIAPTGEDTEAVLRRLLATGPMLGDGPAVPSVGRHSRRVVLRAGVGFTVAVAIAFAAVNLLPSSQTPGGVSDAWAKRVIAHATAAVAGPGTGILHVVETVTTDAPGPNGASSATHTVQSWEQQTAPYAYWVTSQYGSDTSTATLSDDTVERYDSASNTLIEWRDTPPLLEFAQFESDPAYRAAFSLVHQQDLVTASRSAGTQSSSQPPETFSDLIVALLNASGVSVTNATVNGESVISITGDNGNVTLYVQPQTYKPVQFVITRRTGVAPSTVTTTFNTYETLPADSVSMPNLPQLYPSAKTSTTTFGGPN